VCEARNSRAAHNGKISGTLPRRNASCRLDDSWQAFDEFLPLHHVTCRCRTVASWRSGEGTSRWRQLRYCRWRWPWRYSLFGCCLDRQASSYGFVAAFAVVCSLFRLFLMWGCFSGGDTCCTRHAYHHCLPQSAQHVVDFTQTKRRLLQFRKPGRTDEQARDPMRGPKCTAESLLSNGLRIDDKINRQNE
jgi:hypothetical protein